MDFSTLEPALCHTKLHDSMWTDPNYIAEEKLDGGRFFLIKSGSEVKLISQDCKIDLISNFPHILQAAKRLPDNTVIDGELVAPTRKFIDFLYLVSSSPGDSRWWQARTGEAKFYVFDCLFVVGTDLRHKPLSIRRSFLVSLLNSAKGLGKLPLSRRQSKRKFYEKIVSLGSEGVILKNLSSEYGVGWVKCKARLDFSVIITDINSQNSIQIGAYDQEKLVSVGNCTQGDHNMLSDLRSNPEKYLGKVLDVRSQGFQGTSLMSAAWYRLRPDVDPKTVTLAKLFSDSNHAQG